MITKCNVCKGAVRQPANHLKCFNCCSVVHISCANLGESPFLCCKCYQIIFPFQSISNGELELTFEMSIHELADIIDNIDWEERLPETQEKIEICNYYNMHEYRDLLKNAHKNDFLLLHMNIVSLSSKQSKLSNILLTSDRLPEVIALSETKIRISDNITNAYNMDFYDFVHRDTPTHFGGVGFYIKDDLEYETRDDLSLNCDNCEDLWVEIKNKSKKNTVIGVIYRHPRHSFLSFQERLCHTLEKISVENKNVYMCGDYNIDILKISKSQPIKFYYNALMSYSCRLIIDKPTRITNSSATILDHIYTNDYENTIVPGILITDVSDHLPTFAKISSINNDPKETEYYQKRDFSHFDAEKFKKNLENELGKIDLNDYDANTSTEIFNTKFMEIIEKHAPLRFTKKHQKKKAKKPWVSSGIMKAMEDRDKLQEQAISSRSQEIFNQYKKKRNHINRLIFQSRQNFLAQKLHDALNKSKATWQIINDVIGKRKRKRRGVEKINDANGNTISDKKLISNRFNSFFANVGKNMASKIPDQPLKIFTNSVQSSFSFYDSDPIEVHQLIEKLDPKKSTIANCIPTKFLKIACEIASPYISYLFNKCAYAGIYPTILKKAQVLPIHKKGSKLECSNYRPISLLSPLNKIFEKMLCKRINDYFERFQLFTPHQYGFRKNSYTSLAIYDLVENELEVRDKKSATCAIYLDLQKCFDSVDREILLKKLSHYGIRGQALNLLRSYLTDRYQYTLINNFASNIELVEYGVPQGSCLGPLLFLIFINDMPLSSMKLIIKLFADDSLLFVSGKNFDEIKNILKNELPKIQNWFSSNKLTINPSKTEYMINGRVQNENLFDIFLNDTPLSKTNSVKYLGVFIDDQLNWRTHIESLEKKLSTACALICKLRYFVSQSCLLKYYYAHVYSHLQYAILAWGSANQSALKKLNVLHRRAVRLMTLHGPLKNFFKYNPEDSHGNFKNLELFKSCEILKIEDIYKLEMAKLMRKASTNSLPSALNQVFLRPRYPRQKQFLLPLANSKCGEKSLKYAGPKLWESLDPLLKDSSLSHSTFAKK